MMADEKQPEEQAMEVTEFKEGGRPVEAPHPYKDQLENFKQSKKHSSKRIIKTVPALDDTTYTFVSSVEALNDMVAKLKEKEAIAVSVEANFHRSFNEVQSLIQIATYDEQFIVDVMELKEDIGVLNEILTNADIVKVMHHASWSIDRLFMLGLYVVNLFDTEMARGDRKFFKRGTLQFLGDMLKDMFGVKDYNSDLNKAVWTMRPLTEEMIKYSRQNVHYLLHARDRLQNEHIEKNSLVWLYGFCAKNSMRAKRTWTHKFEPLAFIKMYNRINMSNQKVRLTKQQMECFKLLFEWRYHTAESNDESFTFTMSRYLMIALCEAMPKEVEEIKKVCGDSIPPLVEEHIEDIKDIIMKAIEDEPDATTIHEPEKLEWSAEKRPNSSQQGASNAKRGRGASNYRGGRGDYNNRGRGNFNNRGRGDFTQGRGFPGNQSRGAFNARGRGGSPYGPYGGYGPPPFGSRGFPPRGGYAGMGGIDLEGIIRSEVQKALSGVRGSNMNNYRGRGGRRGKK